jgi:diguanylate cyclase (GGDEF)-like protein
LCLFALVVLFDLYLLLGNRREVKAHPRVMLPLQPVQDMFLLDPLTRMFSRRYLDFALAREVAFANRHNTPLALLLFELDDFGSLNSRFGQMAGDQLLIETATLLRGIFGATETLVRYGPDRFLALLPECSSEQAQVRAEQVLGRVRLRNETEGRQYCISLSHGYAEYRPGCNVKDVLAEAEDCLQRHRKQSTGNCARNWLRPNCLIVSRDSDALRVLQPMLESLSVDVETCADTAVALEMLPGRRFEAFVVDMDLPGAANSMALARTLNPARNLVVVALGAVAPSAWSGANFVLQKPLVASRIASALRVICTLMSAERQRYFRHSVSLPVVLQFNSDSEFEAMATDLSEGGMAVRCTRSLEPGRVGTVRFQLSKTDAALQARVRVAWTDGEGRCGLRFVDMSRAARSALDRWLQTRTRTLLAGHKAGADTTSPDTEGESREYGKAKTA